MKEKRDRAFSIDRNIISAVQLTLMLSLVFIPTIRSGRIDLPVIVGKWAIIISITLSLYTMRDLLKGRSIGKRLMKLKIVDIKSGQPANLVQCFLRNVTSLIGPVDFFYYHKKGFRLGDRLAGTAVVEE